jgi:hypothetical protein
MLNVYDISLYVKGEWMSCHVLIHILLVQMCSHSSKKIMFSRYKLQLIEIDISYIRCLTEMDE